MTILYRSLGGKWTKVSKFEFENEAQLQELIYASPELIGDDHTAAVFTREVSLPGSGYTDLIGVDTDGNVLVVETKLAKNPEIRRKVIGQVVEYAAYLWQMPFDNFDQVFIAREGKSVLDLLEEKMPGIDKEQLRESIAETLRAGSFTLLIAVDEMNPELRKIISYLSSREEGLALQALELETYRPPNSEVLVPHRHGAISVPATASSKKVRTIRDVLESCADETSRNLLSIVESTWREYGNDVVPGTVGASFRAQIGSQQRVIFWAYPNYLQAAFNVLIEAGAPADAVENYRNSLSKLQGFNTAKVLKESQPVSKWSGSSEDATKAFLDETQKLVTLWRQTLPQVATIE